MTSTANLLPCPFCSDNNITIENQTPEDNSGGYYIECPTCGASTSLRYACGEDPAPLLAEQWNRRTTAQCLHQIQEPALSPVRPVLDYKWRARLMDGRELVRDQYGFAEHPELPMLDKGMKPRQFFAALGIELRHSMAEDDIEEDELEAMNDAGNWTAWKPAAPAGDGWKLVAIFDTEDGLAAWWVRELGTTQEEATQVPADALPS